MYLDNLKPLCWRENVPSFLEYKKVSLVAWLCVLAILPVERDKSCRVEEMVTYPSERHWPGGHQNPVQAGFVTKEEDWKYSSARDFCGMKGLVSLSYS